MAFIPCRCRCFLHVALRPLPGCAPRIVGCCHDECCTLAHEAGLPGFACCCCWASVTGDLRIGGRNATDGGVAPNATDGDFGALMLDALLRGGEVLGADFNTLVRHSNFTDADFMSLVRGVLQHAPPTPTSQKLLRTVARRFLRRRWPTKSKLWVARRPPVSFDF